MSQIDERQHLFKKTIDFTSPKKYIQSLKHAYINVPFELRFKKGDRVILLSDSNGGKSSLMRAIQSQLKVERGIAWYNGKIAIVTQKLWFRKKSIRDNVTFGEPVVTDKLEKVYKLCRLDSHIRNLPKGDQTII
jgi:ABC-type multidrug transport system fused ATPase/permease subunit